MSRSLHRGLSRNKRWSLQKLMQMPLNFQGHLAYPDDNFLFLDSSLFTKQTLTIFDVPDVPSGFTLNAISDSEIQIYWDEVPGYQTELDWSLDGSTWHSIPSPSNPYIH